LKLLARAADGSLRDGLSLLDQAIAFGNGEVRQETVEQMLGTVAQQPVDDILLALANNDAVALLQKIADITALTPDFSEILQQILRVLHRVALTQTIADFVDHDFDSQCIAELADKLLPEDVQLFYQIGLIGQRDLDLAPDPRSGFEMIMLRMLTFKPHVETVAVSSPRMTVDKVSKPEITTQLPTTAVATVIEKIPQATTTDNWADIVVALNVKGMTRELANNCVLESMDDRSCCLLLNPGHTQLISPRAEANLQQALQEYVGKPIKLTIKTEQNSSVTPAQQITKKREDRQQAAVDSINADENVQSLKDQFDARVMPGSIEPI